MGLDQYMSAKKSISYEKDRNVYFDILNLFGSFSTKPEATVSFYVSDWSHNEKKSVELQQFQGVIDLMGLQGFIPDSSPSMYVNFDRSGMSVEIDAHVAYWRKANQVHNWFVANIQGGEDECNPFPASREKLEELVAICKQVLNRTEVEVGEVHVGTTWTSEDPEFKKVYEEGLVIVEPAVAQELLPTQGGFFFGGTGYDEWYVRDLDDTITQIEKALELPEEWSFVYQSSW